MANKDVLKFRNSYVPTINDAIQSEFEAYETYSRKKIDEKISANSSGSNNTPTVNTEYNWSGKKITFEGDSITGNSVMGYPAYVSNKTGCDIINISIAGVPVTPNAEGNSHDFRRRISNIPADTDAIIILGDCNAQFIGDDIIGDIEDNNKSKDISKWVGRWHVSVEAIKRSFPTVPLFLVSQYPMRGKERTNRLVPYLFSSIARRYGAITVSLGEESPLSLVSPTACKVWGFTAKDGVHCSHGAMPLFADAIIKHLKEVPPFEWTGTDELVLNTTELNVTVGSTADIDYSITGDLSIQWTSDNMDVACVMGGRVYGMTAGTATITATTRNGNTATCTVTVSEN